MTPRRYGLRPYREPLWRYALRELWLQVLLPCLCAAALVAVVLFVLVTWTRP